MRHRVSLRHVHDLRIQPQQSASASTAEEPVTGSSTAIAFAAVAAGVAALGSFLSPTRHPREAELVQYAKAILDDPTSMRTPSVHHIIAVSPGHDAAQQCLDRVVHAHAPLRSGLAARGREHHQDVLRRARGYPWPRCGPAAADFLDLMDWAYHAVL
ncbi:hypothetical protein FQN53_008490 [Emmonsiellopsis sp. PD_33]|nr:hypothetical protein FQN53_008490 [Emmonsiellopsis sp. PD_33]